MPTTQRIAASILLFGGLGAGLAHTGAGGKAAGVPRTDFLGDPLPEHALLRIGTTRLQHWGSILAVAASADGRRLASCGQDQLVRVWDARDGKPLQKIKLPHGWTWALAFSADGKELAAVSRSFAPKTRGAFFRWDLETGRQLHGEKDAPELYAGNVAAVALAGRAGGGHVVAETIGKGVYLYVPGDAKTGKVLKGHVGRVMGVALTRDGKTLVSLGEDGTIRFWDGAAGTETAQRKVPAMKGHSLNGNLATIAVAPDGKTVAVSLPDHSTRLLDMIGRERRLPSEEFADALAFSADGKTLITGDRVLRTWDVATGQEVAIGSESRAPVHRLALSPDGKTIAFADADEQLRLAEVATGKTFLRAKVAARAGIAFAPDGKHLAVAAGDKTIALWQAAKPFAGQPAAVVACAGKVITFALAPDGKRLATAEDGGWARVYDIAAKQPRLTLKASGRGVYAVAFSPNGKLLASMGEQFPSGVHVVGAGDAIRAVRLWDAASGKEMPVGAELRWLGHTVVFHPSGKTLVGLHLPEVAKAPIVGYKTFGEPPAPVEQRMETVRVWDIAAAHERLRFDDPRARAAAARATAWVIGRSSAEPAAFSPDGRVFAMPGFGGIVLFETASGKPRLRLPGHLQAVKALAFTPDATTLVSGSTDGTVLIWDVTGLKTAAKLPGTAEALYATLADPDAERAGRAVWAMVAAPAESVAVLRRHLKPVPPGQDTLAKWIADLDDDTFAVRDRAMRALAAEGPAAEKALTQRLASRPPLETLRRIELLLRTIRTAPPPSATLQMLRAVEVLEHVGTAAARAHLHDLANGADGAWLTVQARAALARLQSR